MGALMTLLAVAILLNIPNFFKKSLFNVQYDLKIFFITWKIEWFESFKRSLYGTEFVVPFSSRSHYLSENIAIFHSNDNLFTQYLFLNKKRCHLMTFSWQLESERTRARGTLLETPNLLKRHTYNLLSVGLFHYAHFT